MLTQGKTFPGKLSPRPPLIEPRRMNLPPNFAEEWKMIGYRRDKFEDLGLPVPKAVDKERILKNNICIV